MNTDATRAALGAQAIGQLAMMVKLHILSPQSHPNTHAYACNLIEAWDETFTANRPADIQPGPLKGNDENF